MEQLNGSANPSESNVNGQGSQVSESASAIPQELQQYVVETPASPVNAPQTDQSGQTQSQTFQDASHFQRIADQRLAENYRLQQELQRVQQAQAQQVQQNNQSEKNPYDPNVDWFNAIRWEQQQAATQSARLAAQEAMQNIMSYAQQQQAQQMEMAWQQAHPNVDINMVKGFAQQRGIRNVDDAYTLMNMPNILSQTQQTTAQAAFQNFRQPQSGTTPIRGGQSTPQEIKLSYAQMANEFANTNGKVYESWTPEMKSLFDKETYGRAESPRR